MIEANIDDLNPQVFGYVMDRLLEEGALDAFGIPVQMKKNRPGMLLSVLCRPEDAGKLTSLTESLDRQCAPFPLAREPVWDGDRVAFGVEDDMEKMRQLGLST